MFFFLQSFCGFKERVIGLDDYFKCLLCIESVVSVVVKYVDCIIKVLKKMLKYILCYCVNVIEQRVNFRVKNFF